jgi:translation initiation factor IF-2
VLASHPHAASLRNTRAFLCVASRHAAARPQPFEPLRFNSRARPARCGLSRTPSPAPAAATARAPPPPQRPACAPPGPSSSRAPCASVRPRVPRLGQLLVAHAPARVARTRTSLGAATPCVPVRRRPGAPRSCAAPPSRWLSRAAALLARCSPAAGPTSPASRAPRTAPPATPAGLPPPGRCSPCSRGSNRAAASAPPSRSRHAPVPAP